jgi:shikimate 5-dehydrogenase
MLVWQGAQAFDVWTNQGLAIEEIAAVMRPVCERALRS